MDFLKEKNYFAETLPVYLSAFLHSHILSTHFPFILNRYIRSKSGGRITGVVRPLLSAGTGVSESAVITGSASKPVL